MDDNQSDGQVEPIQESQEDSSEDEQDSQSDSDDDEPPSVSKRPWTRSHFAVDRTIDLLRDRFYWPYMLEDTKDHIGLCHRWQMAKGKQQLAPLQPYHASAPMELVYMDYLTIEHGKTGKDINILIITDHYYRFAQAVKTSNQTALTVWIS